MKTSFSILLSYLFALGMTIFVCSFNAFAQNRHINSGKCYAETTLMTGEEVWIEILCEENYTRIPKRVIYQALEENGCGGGESIPQMLSDFQQENNLPNHPKSVLLFKKLGLMSYVSGKTRLVKPRNISVTKQIPPSPSATMCYAQCYVSEQYESNVEHIFDSCSPSNANFEYVPTKVLSGVNPARFREVILDLENPVKVADNGNCYFHAYYVLSNKLLESGLYWTEAMCPEQITPPQWRKLALVLIEQGYKIDGETNTFSPAFQTALQQFQTANNLPVPEPTYDKMIPLVTLKALGF